MEIPIFGATRLFKGFKRKKVNQTRLTGVAKNIKLEKTKTPSSMVTYQKGPSLQSTNQFHIDNTIAQGELRKNLNNNFVKLEDISKKTKNPGKTSTSLKDIITGNDMVNIVSTAQKGKEVIVAQKVNSLVDKKMGESVSPEIKLEISDIFTDSIFLQNELKIALQEGAKSEYEIFEQTLFDLSTIMSEQSKVKEQENILSIEESKEVGRELTKGEEKSITNATELITKPEERAQINQLSEPFTRDQKTETLMQAFEAEENISRSDTIFTTITDVIESKEPDLGSQLILQNEGYGVRKINNDAKNFLVEKLPDMKPFFENGSSMLVIDPKTNILNAFINTDMSGNSTIIYNTLSNIKQVPKAISDAVTEVVEGETEKKLGEIESLEKLFQENLQEKEVPKEEMGETPEPGTIEEVAEELLPELEKEPSKITKKETKLTTEQREALEREIEAERKRVEALQQKAQEEVIEQFTQTEKTIETVNLSEAKLGEVISKETVIIKPEPITTDAPLIELQPEEIIQQEVKTFSESTKKDIDIFNQQSDVLNKKRALDTKNKTEITDIENKSLDDIVLDFQVKESEILETTKNQIQDIISKTEITPDIMDTIESLQKETTEKLNSLNETAKNTITESDVTSNVAKEYAQDTITLISDSAKDTLDITVEKAQNTLDYRKIQEGKNEQSSLKNILATLKKRLEEETRHYKKIANNLSQMRTRQQKWQNSEQGQKNEQTRKQQKELLSALLSTITTIITSLAINNYESEEVETLKNMISETENLLQETEEEKPISAKEEQVPSAEEKGVIELKKKIKPKRFSNYVAPMINQFAKIKNTVIPAALSQQPHLEKITPLYHQELAMDPKMPLVDRVQHGAFMNDFVNHQQYNIDTLDQQLTNTQEKVEKKLEEIEQGSEKKREEPPPSDPSISDYKKIFGESVRKEEEKKTDKSAKITGESEFDFGSRYHYDDAYDFFDTSGYDYNFDTFDSFENFDDFDFLSDFYDFEDFEPFRTKEKKPEQERAAIPLIEKPIMIDRETEPFLPKTKKDKIERESARNLNILEEEKSVLEQEKEVDSEKKEPAKITYPQYKTYLTPALAIITIGCAILFYFLL